MAYKKCPRCSLNYVKDTETLCMVCLEDLGKSSRLNVDDDDYDICPECGENVIKSGEELCYQCLIERTKESAEEPIKKVDEWDEIPPVTEVGDAFNVELDEQTEDLGSVGLDTVQDDEHENIIIPDDEED